MTVSSSGKSRILVFGEKVYGSMKPDFQVDYCDIDIFSFPSEYENLPELKNYDIVILDYAAFDSQGHQFIKYQDAFLKQLYAAVKINSTYFCFLHYDEETPNVETMYGRIIDRGAIDELERSQIGLWLLNRCNIYPVNVDSLILNIATKRTEFNHFQQNWGSSKITFNTYGEGEIDETIFEVPEGEVIGFSLKSHKGKFLFLPCLRDFNRPATIKACLTSLIKAVLTYKTQSSLELPDWAKNPIFPRETELDNRRSELKVQIDEIESEIALYQVAKQIALLSEYEFQEAVPNFFGTHLHISTYVEEEYKEDFWIINENKEKIVICETKSKMKGLDRHDINKLDAHRDSRGLDDKFPALLIITAHLNGGSWKDKNRKIDKQDFELASKNNILIVRIEDLLYFWNQIVEAKKSKDDLLNLLTIEKGWLEVQPDGQCKVHK